MNRLQAAKMVRVGLNLQTADGAVHFDTYEGKILRSYTNNDNVRSEWEEVGWKVLLKFIRENYIQRDDECCNHKYEVWDTRGYHLVMKVRCVNTYNHFHCAACGAAETATGVCDKLCFECQEKSDAERRKLTSAILDYEGKFGIKFKETPEWRDQFEGVYDYESSTRSYREDFHADG